MANWPAIKVYLKLWDKVKFWNKTNRLGATMVDVRVY